MMNTWMKRGWSIALAAVTASCAKREDVFKIGFSAPLSGGQAAMGQDLYNGVELAVEEWNAKGGIAGKRLVIAKMDDEARPEVARNVATKLASDPQVLAVVGHLNSGCTMPASEVYAQEGLMMITPCATNPDVTTRGLKNVFRACTTDAVQGEAGADYAVRILKKKAVAMVHDNSQYGKGLAEFFKKRAEALGAKVVAFEAILQVSEGGRDYNTVLTRIKGLKPDLVYYGGMYPEAILLVKQMRELGLPAVFMSGDGVYSDTEFISKAGASAEGTVVSFLAPPYDRFAPEFYKRFVEKYQRIESYSPYAYDAANIALEALARAAAGGAPTRERVTEEMRRTKDYKGVMGIINFDDKGDRTDKAIYFYRARGSKFEWLEPSNTSG